MRDYMPRMIDIADQLMDKWSRLNVGEEVDVPADMTRLTLDTIALCGFGYRFNSFYRETPHPFVQAMVRTLSEAQARARQLPIQTRLKIRAQRQVEEDQAFMDDLVDRLVAERRAQGDDGDTTDLLGRMLHGVDAQSGDRLPDSNIRAQCVTFLIAGHETTSGPLSFAIYYLLKDPGVLERARAEVDEILGDTADPTFEQVHRLTYLRQVLDESLRLWPTAPGFTRYPLEDTVIGGRYAVPAHTAITVLTPALHRARSVWGADALEFNPDHMAPERLAGVSPTAYKPFGSGLRACIGRQFALQEATLVLGMLLQRFDLVDHLEDLPRGGVLIVVTSSYNGTPPDNAAAFCRWLSEAAPNAAKDVGYSVFGCGDTDWAATYQAVPKLIDEQLEKHGGHRLHARGEGNAAEDFDADYRTWHGDVWAEIAEALDLPDEVGQAAPSGPRLAITLTNRQVTNPVIVSYAAHPGLVHENRELIARPADGAPAARSVRHLEIGLPPGMTYQAGDHLGVLPRNSFETIRRVMACFGLDAGQYITIIPNSGTHTHLPIDEPTPLLGVLGSCVELQDVASRDDLAVLAQHTDDQRQRAALEATARDDAEGHSTHRDEVHLPNRSVLDMLERFPACKLPFEEYLDLLPPLRPRYYSISSSAPAEPGFVQHHRRRAAGTRPLGPGTFSGVCSGHLAAAPVSGTVFVFVRRPSIPFRPPENPHVPMVMVGAGTGLAPFRGFLQERAVLQDQRVPIGRSLLFFGCRHPEVDQLYADELAGWERQGVVRVERCFSAAPRQTPRYVQQGMRECADEIWDLLQHDAVVLVCGNAATIAPGVRASLATIFRERTGAGEKDAEAWLAGLRAGSRLVEDIWGG